ncbi:MAG: restriction endonuclease [Alphaproteobacteria bacterium]|nr:restriction endonuclease [Alphaproteobacteria bacterium]
MDIAIKNLINSAVSTMIEKTSAVNKMTHLQDKHEVKVHFIPKRYRVFGGLLQSMNIQFGNFIEELMTALIDNETKYEILKEYSGKKSNSFRLSVSNDKRIDEYITRCQTEQNMDLCKEFATLQDDILNDTDSNTNKFKHDIDILFKNTETGTIYYVESKYNDDHDTGKFVDINRKIIKTYAYLAREFDIQNSSDLVPILFFFTNKKMKGNIYIPEQTNILRGRNFFEKFLSVKYSDVDDYLSNLSESDDVVRMFDELYSKVMNS